MGNPDEWLDVKIQKMHELLIQINAATNMDPNARQFIYHAIIQWDKELKEQRSNHILEDIDLNDIQLALAELHKDIQPSRRLQDQIGHYQGDRLV